MLTDKQIEAGWEQTFSTNNPFCPCDLKTFTKAARWAERAAHPSPQGAEPAGRALSERNMERAWLKTTDRYVISKQAAYFFAHELMAQATRPLSDGGEELRAAAEVVVRHWLADTGDFNADIARLEKALARTPQAAPASQEGVPSAEARLAALSAQMDKAIENFHSLDTSDLDPLLLAEAAKVVAYRQAVSQGASQEAAAEGFSLADLGEACARIGLRDSTCEELSMALEEIGASVRAPQAVAGPAPAVADDGREAWEIGCCCANGCQLKKRAVAAGDDTSALTDFERGRIQGLMQGGRDGSAVAKLLQFVLDDIAICRDSHASHGTEWAPSELSVETVAALDEAVRQMPAAIDRAAIRPSGEQSNG